MAMPLQSYTIRYGQACAEPWAVPSSVVAEADLCALRITGSAVVAARFQQMAADAYRRAMFELEMVNAHLALAPLG